MSSSVLRVPNFNFNCGHFALLAAMFHRAVQLPVRVGKTGVAIKKELT